MVSQVVENWYPTAGEKKGVLLVVTSSKEGAVVGGKDFVESIGDDLIDSIVADNIPIYTEEEKYNQTVISSIERLEAKLNDKPVPGGCSGCMRQCMMQAMGFVLELCFNLNAQMPVDVYNVDLSCYAHACSSASLQCALTLQLAHPVQQYLCRMKGHHARSSSRQHLYVHMQGGARGLCCCRWVPLQPKATPPTKPPHLAAT